MLPRNHLTASKSPSMITAWWPMPACSSQPPWPCTSVFPNWYSNAPGRANRIMTLVPRWLADCIDDADSWDGLSLPGQGAIQCAARWGHANWTG